MVAGRFPLSVEIPTVLPFASPSHQALALALVSTTRWLQSRQLLDCADFSPGIRVQAVSFSSCDDSNRTYWSSECSANIGFPDPLSTDALRGLHPSVRVLDAPATLRRWLLLLCCHGWRCRALLCIQDLCVIRSSCEDLSVNCRVILIIYICLL
jgi:hypothetical protein